MADGLIPHILIGSIFYIFGLKWCCEYAKFWDTPKRSEGMSSTKSRILMGKCEKLLMNNPIEGFLFVWASPDRSITNGIAAAIVWTTAITIGAELIWPDLKLLRATTTLLHGGWIAHMVRLFRSETLATERIALAFSWHIAAAFAVTLIVVATARSCAPNINIHDEPPDVPIYDYCNEPHDMT
ncbi:uncharacterized protein [Fopius arisanus]|uniref:Uncharacterized protein isoform X3 n=2 Tax=Fopius arisanus TaxID=64838 RepID=A0A9R1TVB2_9HYME|nr:PREDICTED: uncharacterized protein LOC105264206 isoform X3 [Fopius arisanus]